MEWSRTNMHPVNDKYAESKSNSVVNAYLSLSAVNDKYAGY